MIACEADILEKMFRRRINAVSFHQPSFDVLQGKVDTGERINTYSKEHLRGYFYISDSNRVFKLFPDAAKFIESLNGQSIQLLIHPMWWVYENSPTTNAVWDQALLANFNLAQIQLHETERAFGEKREFKIISEMK